MASAKFGNLFDTVIQAATVVLPFVTNGRNAQGQSISITQQITELVTQLHSLEVAFAQLPFPQRLQNANNALTAAQQIRTAYDQLHGTGTDATYLANEKQVADRVIAHIQQMIAEAQNASVNNTPVNNTPVQPTTQPTTTNNTPVTLPNGQVVYVPSQQVVQGTNQIINGVDNLYLFGGLGILAYLLLKK